MITDLQQLIVVVSQVDPVEIKIVVNVVFDNQKIGCLVHHLHDLLHHAFGQMHRISHGDTTVIGRTIIYITKSCHENSFYQG